MSAMFRALENRNYRLWSGRALISNIGTWMQRIALDWLVLTVRLTFGTALGITTGLQSCPCCSLGPYAESSRTATATNHPAVDTDGQRPGWTSGGGPGAERHTRPP